MSVPIVHRVRLFFLRGWIEVKLFCRNLFAKKTVEKKPIVQKLQMEAPKPKESKPTIERLYKRYKKKISGLGLMPKLFRNWQADKRHPLHKSHFGTFRARKPLPKVIFLGRNRENSITYRHSIGVPCSKHV